MATPSASPPHSLRVAAPAACGRGVEDVAEQHRVLVPAGGENTCATRTDANSCRRLAWLIRQQAPAQLPCCGHRSQHALCSHPTYTTDTLLALGPPPPPLRILSNLPQPSSPAHQAQSLAERQPLGHRRHGHTQHQVVAQLGGLARAVGAACGGRERPAGQAVETEWVVQVER